MKSGRNPLILGAVLIVVLAALFLILKPGDSDDSSDPVVTNSATETQEQPATKKAKPKPPPVPTVVIKNGEPVDGVLGIEVDQGDQIKFKVESDVDEEIHVHGYDISKDVSAGGSTTLSFPADLPGIYEAELELSGVPIVELQVNS